MGKKGAKTLDDMKEEASFSTGSHFDGRAAIH
jgi:hypothetical protein